MNVCDVFEQLVSFECMVHPRLMLPDLSLVHLNVTENFYSPLIDQVFLPIDLQKAVYKRKLEFLSGRYCASKALSHFNIVVKLVDRNEDRTPQWPMNYTGSISHTDHQAIACVASTQNYSAIGIDIEKIITEDFYPALKNHVITADELKLIHQDGNDKLILSTLIFSAKESLYKLLYKQTNVSLDFYSACLISISSDEFILQLGCDVNKKYKKGSLIKGRYVISNNNIITLLAEASKV